MIKTESEYEQTKIKFAKQQQELEKHREKLRANKFTEAQIKLATGPHLSFALQLKEEAEEYEQIKKGNFNELINFYDIGKLLIAVRIYKDLKQSDLATKLGVADSQVSRDETNEYHGASIEKIQKVLMALEVELKTQIQLEILKSA